ncbi:MAG: PAS domain-containing protein [Candidatus Pacebacteria bacterium]|nr:PAS domain-containing protein [Candidatus Paceibacterota bacterium]
MVYPLLKAATWTLHLVVLYGLGAAIILATLVMFCLQRMNSGKPKDFIWAWQFFSVWVVSLTTFLFWPVIGVFLSVLNCQNTNGTWTHVYHPEVSCSENTYVVHIVLGVVFAVLFTIFSVVFGLLLYETRTEAVQRDATARLHAHCEAWEVAYKTVLTIAALCLKWYGGAWVLAIFMFITTAFFYCIYANSYRFYNRLAERCWCCFSLLHVWIAACFCYQLIVQGNDGLGGPQIMIFGCPIVLLVALLRRDTFWHVLVAQVHSQHSPEVYLNMCMAFHALLRERGILLYRELPRVETERTEDSLLRGYVLFHTQQCKSKDCILAGYCRALMQDPVSKENMKRSEKDQAERTKASQEQLLLSFLANEYSKAAELYPKFTGLRIAYILFLIEKYRNSTMALSQIAYLESLEPSFEARCQLHRYRNMIKEELIEGNKDDSEKANVTSVIVYETQLTHFRAKIEKTGILHLQIWSLLLDDSPDLSKILSYGFKVEELVAEIESHWEIIQEINPNVPKVLKLYAKFNKEILNDKETGTALSDRAKDYNYLKANFNRRKMQALNTSNISAVSSDGTPCIYVSGQQNKAGIITQCNSAVCRLFGYTKKELLGNNIIMLMPEVYAAYHQDILLKNIQELMQGDATPTGGTAAANTKDRLVFGKNKSGFVFPVWFRLFSTPTLLNNSNYIGLLQTEKKTASSEIAYFLLNRRREVTHMSSSAIALFGLYPYMLKYARLRLGTICPDTGGSLEQSMFGVTGGLVTQCFVPDLTTLEMGGGCEKSTVTLAGDLTPNLPAESHKSFDNSSKGRAAGENDLPCLRRSQVAFSASCGVETISFTDYGTVGYFARIERVDESGAPEDYQPEKTMACPTFQFRFDEPVSKFVRELRTAGDSTHARSLRKGYTFTSRSGSIKTKSNHNESNGENEQDEDEGELSPVSELKRQLSSVSGKGSSFFQLLAPKIKQISKFIEGEKESEANSAINRRLFEGLQRQRVDYAEGVRTYRLLDNKLVEVTDNPLQTMLVTSDVTQEYVSDYVSDGQRTDYSKKTAFLIANNIKSRKSLESVLGEGKLIENTVLKLVSYILLCGLMMFAVMDYVYTTDFYDAIKTHTLLTSLNYDRMLFQQFTLYNVREATLLNLYPISFHFYRGYFTKYSDYYSMNKSAYAAYLQSNMQTGGEDLYQTHKEVTRKTLSLSEYESYAQYNTMRSIDVTLQVNDTYTVDEYVSMVESILQYTSALFTSANEDYDELNETNRDVSYILTNGVDTIMYGLVYASRLYMSVIGDHNSCRSSTTASASRTRSSLDCS